jgi:hypothetical protein
VAFPAKLNTFGEAGLCSLVMVNVGGLVLLPDGRVPELLPRERTVTGGIGNFGGMTLPVLFGNILPGNCLTVLLLGVAGAVPVEGGLPVRPRVPVYPKVGRRPGRPVCPLVSPPVRNIKGFVQ